jgi:DNA-binding IclR family transcriptional regulator
VTRPSPGGVAVLALRALSAGAASPQALADCLGRTPKQAASLIHTLRRHGLAATTRRHGRAHYSLTPAGRARAGRP